MTSRSMRTLGTAAAVWACLLLAACGVGLRSSPTLHPIAPDSLLPPIPAFVQSFLGPVPVERVDSIGVPTPAGSRVLGVFDVFSRRIYLRRDLTNPVTAWQILHHERCHVLLWDAGVKSGSAQFDNLLCDVYATAAVRDQLELLARGRR